MMTRLESQRSDDHYTTEELIKRKQYKKNSLLIDLLSNFSISLIYQFSSRYNSMQRAYFRVNQISDIYPPYAYVMLTQQL